MEAQTGPFDLQVRYQIYQFFANQCQAPAYQEIAAILGVTEAKVRQSFHTLHDRHLVFLQPGTDAIRIASPFSAIPTRYKVSAGARAWWATCGWDSAGIAAALHADVHIRAEYPDSPETVEFDVIDGKLDGKGHVVYFALGAKHWYDDLVYT